MSALTILALAASGSVFAAIVILAPRLAIRPSLRSALWYLRDEISDACRHEALPYDDEAPRALLHRIEAAILASDEITFAGMLWATPAIRRIPPEVKAAIDAQLNPDISHLTKEERELYHSFDLRFRILLLKTTFLGSWSGLVSLFIIIPVALGALVGSRLSTRFRTLVRAKVHERQVITEEIALELSYSVRRDELALCST